MKGCRPLTDEEILILSKTFSGAHELRDRALFVTGVRTGLRIAELLSIRVGDVYVHDEVVERVYIRREATKGKVEGRSLPLHAEARWAIKALLDERSNGGPVGDDEYLFKSQKGGPLSTVQAHRIITGVAEANGLSGKVATHSMRKSFASRMYERLGHDLVKLQHALGHRHITSTTAYIGFAESDVDAAILAA